MPAIPPPSSGKRTSFSGCNWRNLDIGKVSFPRVAWTVEDENILIDFSHFTYVAVHDTARSKSVMPMIGFWVLEGQADLATAATLNAVGPAHV